MVITVLDNDNNQMQKMYADDFCGAMRSLIEFVDFNNLSFNAAKKIITNDVYRSMSVIGDITDNNSTAGTYTIEWDM